MNQHVREEAIVQGRCSLLAELAPDRAAVTLLDPDGGELSGGSSSVEDSSVEAVREGLRRAYRTMFNETESRYSQKLCRVTGLRVSAMQGGQRDAEADSPLPELCAVLPLSDGPESPVLSEEAARLLDPLGNLRPGVPVQVTTAEKQAKTTTEHEVTTAKQEAEPAGEPEKVDTVQEVEDVEAVPEAGEAKEVLANRDAEEVTDEENLEEGRAVEIRASTQRPECGSGFPEILEHYQETLKQAGR